MPEASEPLVPAPELATAQVEITLKYDGKDVDDGTMPIDDVITALRGFSNAYGKIASAQDPQGQHQIRVSAINKSSFAISILAWVAEHKAVLVAATPIATLIVTTIIKVIELKKRTKGQPPSSVTVNGSNNTVVITAAGDNTQIVVPREVYDLYHSKTLDGELSKIVDPLTEGKIDAVSLSAKDAAGSQIDPVVITSSERAFFHSEETVTATSKPVTLKGKFVSLNKESNRGLFKMENGSKVRYHFAGGEDAAQLHADFAYKGPVAVECIATFDSNLELKSIDIASVTKLQGDLF